MIDADQSRFDATQGAILPPGENASHLCIATMVSRKIPHCGRFEGGGFDEVD